MVLETITFYLINFSLFGNEIWRYFAFIFIIGLSYPAGKFFAFFLGNYLLKWAQKTKIKFDELLVRSLNPPITMFVFAALFFVAKEILNPGVYDVLLNKIFNFLLIIPLVYFMIKFSTEALGFYLKGDKRKDINEAGIDLMMQVIRIALLIIGILLILANLGYNINALLTGLGVGGLAFALAAQDILKNFFAGVAMILDKTFKKGDRIRFEGNVSFVNEVKLRTTKLRTLDGTILTVPNSKLAENTLENIAMAPKVKTSFTIGLVYATTTAQLKQAKEIIEKILEKDEDIERYWVFFDNFGAFSLDINVTYFMKYTYSDWPARGICKERINLAVKEEIEKAGMSFAFPTQTIELMKK